MKELRSTVVLVVLLLALAVGSALPATAEDPQRSGLELRQLQGLLDLRVDQIARLAPVLKTYREQHRARLTSFRTQLRSVLTAEQAARFDDLCKQYRRGQGQSRGLKGLQAELALTSDQVGRIGVIRSGTREQARTDYASFVSQVKEILTPEQFERFQDVTQRTREGNEH